MHRDDLVLEIMFVAFALCDIGIQSRTDINSVGRRTE